MKVFMVKLIYADDDYKRPTSSSVGTLFSDMEKAEDFLRSKLIKFLEDDVMECGAGDREKLKPYLTKKGFLRTAIKRDLEKLQEVVRQVAVGCCVPKTLDWCIVEKPIQ